MKYKPNPIDLSNIKLDDDLSEDVEAIAKNIHETWALQRQRNGWNYGSQHDNKIKTHPDMVEYDELSEQEKDVDRATVIQTIKMLLWLGYKIEKQ